MERTLELTKEPLRLGSPAKHRTKRRPAIRVLTTAITVLIMAVRGLIVAIAVLVLEVRALIMAIAVLILAVRVLTMAVRVLIMAVRVLIMAGWRGTAAAKL